MKRSIILALLIASAAVPATASAQTTVYSSLPLSGPATVQTQAVNDGARQALQEAGGMAGGHGDQVRDAQRRDQAGRQLDARAGVPERPPGRAGRRGARGHRPVQLGRRGVSIPIINEAGVPVISPSNTYIGLTTRRRRARPGRAGQVLPDRRAHLLPHPAQRPRPGRRAGDGDARRRLQARRRRQRPRGLRRRHGEADARLRQAARDEGRVDDRDPQDHATVRLDQGRLHRLHRHHGQRRDPHVQTA